jgi:hypothetical protein
VTKHFANLNTDFDRDRDSFFGRGICEELLERFNILDTNKFTLKAVFTILRKLSEQFFELQ